MTFPGSENNTVFIVAYFSVGCCLGAERQICTRGKKTDAFSRFRKKYWVCWCVTDKRRLLISFRALWWTAFGCSGACMKNLVMITLPDLFAWCYLWFILGEPEHLSYFSFSYPPPLPLTVVVNLCSYTGFLWHLSYLVESTWKGKKGVRP